MTPHPQPLKDPCECCQYKSQACAYWLDGEKFESACINKQWHLKEAAHTPAAPAVDVISELDGLCSDIPSDIEVQERHDAAIRKAEREKVLRGKLEIIDSVIEQFHKSNLDDMQTGFLNGLLHARNRIFGSEQKSLRAQQEEQ